MESSCRIRPHSASVHLTRSHRKGMPFDEESALHLTQCTVAYLTVKKSVSEDLTTQEELAHALQLAGHNPSKKAIASYWCDSMKNGMSFERFCDVVEAEDRCSRTGDSFDVPLRAFLKLDPNGAGRIGRIQLFRVMTTSGERMSKKEFEKIFEQSPFMIDDFFYYVDFCHSIETTLEICRNRALETARGQEKEQEATPIKQKERPKTCIPQSTSMAIDQLHVNDGQGSNLKEWDRCKSRGTFYLDEEGNVITHQYILELATASNVWLTIEPLHSNPIGVDPVDCILYVLKAGDGGAGLPLQLVTFTENTDENGCHYLGNRLEAGRYILQPFTSGCRLINERRDSVNNDGFVQCITVKLTRNSSVGEEGWLQLTNEYRSVLKDIFKVIDLDGNGRLSRQEFALFQWQSCGEEVRDDDWRALKENFEMEEDELTLNGFLFVHLLEAQNNNGDEDDLWKTLRCMGYDSSLKLVRACPFLITVCTEEQGARIRVSALKRSGPTLEKTICRHVLEMGTSSKIRNLNDLILYSYAGRHSATLAIQNKAHSTVAVRLDCSLSQNCCSHRGNLDYVLHVPPKTMKVGHHLVPLNEKESWQVICNESLVK